MFDKNIARYGSAYRIYVPKNAFEPVGKIEDCAASQILDTVDSLWARHRREAALGCLAM